MVKQVEHSQHGQFLLGPHIVILLFGELGGACSVATFVETNRPTIDAPLLHCLLRPLGPGSRVRFANIWFRNDQFACDYSLNERRSVSIKEIF